MASITIRKFDDGLKARLRVQAARAGRSMEDEAREILRTALADADAIPQDVAAQIRRRFQPLGGVEIELPPREPVRDPPEFEA